MFIISFLSFVCLSQPRWSDLVSLTPCYYALTVTGVFLLIAWLFNIEQESLPYFLPLSCIIGVFLGYTMKAMWYEVLAGLCRASYDSGLPQFEYRYPPNQVYETLHYGSGDHLYGFRPQRTHGVRQTSSDSAGLYAAFSAPHTNDLQHENPWETDRLIDYDNGTP